MGMEDWVIFCSYLNTFWDTFTSLRLRVTLRDSICTYPLWDFRETRFMEVVAVVS